MGIFSRINRAWSGADFWDKKENQKQRQQFAAEDRRKKRREDEERATAAPSVQRPQGGLLPEKPTFDFTQLKTPTNIVSAPKAQEYDAQALDNVGVKAPKQGLLDKVRDQFDANTDADKFRRARETTQKVTKQLSDQGVDPRKAQETAAKIAKTELNNDAMNSRQSDLNIFNKSRQAIGANVAGGLTGIVKGAVELPSFALQAPKLIRLGAAKATGNKEAEENIAKDEGIMSQMARNYEKFVSPVTRRLISAELATDKAAEQAAPWAPTYVKPGVKAATNVLPVDALLSGLINLSRARNVEKVFREGETAISAPTTAGIVPRVVPQEVGDLLTDTQIDDLMPRDIPVGRGIDVVDRGEGAINLPVRDLTPDAPLIRELGGDTPNVVRMPNPQEIAEQTAARQFADQEFPVPDPRIEGMTPREPETPLILNNDEVKASQDQAIAEYAGFLRDMGEGNGVNMIKSFDGNIDDGYRRVSNNVRFGDTKGKRMTKADWREEAERQLRAGKADPAVQKQFDDAANPEVQSLLKNTGPEAPDGRPIRVQEARGIDVQDQTEVPTGMPETPGKVRVSEQNSPMAAKTEAAAVQPVVSTTEGTKLYRGAGNEDTLLRDRGRGTSFSKSRKVADKFAESDELGFKRNNRGIVGEYELAPDAKIISYNAKTDGNWEDFVKDAKADGYDAIDRTYAVDPKLGYAPEDEIRVLNQKAIQRVNQAPETQSVADQLPPIPKIGATMPDGTKVTKRMVDSSRNQRKLAKARAKAEQQTTEFVEKGREARAERTAPDTEEQFAETGVMRNSPKSGAYEASSRQTEKQLGQKEMANRDAEDLALELASSNSLSRGAGRRIDAAKENLVKADPDNARKSELYRVLERADRANRRDAAKIMALVPRVIRKSASSDEIVNRFDRKLGRVLDDPGRISDDDWTRLQRSTDDFTSARDDAYRLEEKFRKTNSEADFNAWEKAHEKARQADVNAKMTEADVAKGALKGDRSAEATKVLDELKKEADVNTMDFITANMLSGTATGFRNWFGTELAGIENRLFANTRAKIVRNTPLLKGENVGGYDKSGARMGRKVGVVKWVGDMKRRGEHGGKNPIEWAKNWSTTINSAGESSLQSQAMSRLAKYYKNEFEADGLTGKQLDLRMRHAMLTDPDEVGEAYMDAAMKSSGLTGMFEKGQTIEKAVTDFVGRQTDSRIGQGAAKLIMRLAVGFPTATTNFMYQSAKRLALGIPDYAVAGAKIAKGDKAGAAVALDRAMKESGSGAAMWGLGYALGNAGMVSGPYPSDKGERARWEREGISENSINIGGNWFPIPQGLGMLGLPLLTGAAIGREGDSNESLGEMYSPGNLAKLLPTDQLQGFLNMGSGNGAPQDLKNFLASGVRATTPVGALLNQVSKSFDDTKNDTTTKGFWNNVLDQVMSGIPGVNNLANIPDKKDDDGNVIKNPDPLPLAFGAISATQGTGQERSAEIDAQNVSALQGISTSGALEDKNLIDVLDDDTKSLYNRASKGDKLTPEETTKLKKALVEGVSETGEDTAYLEKGQYETNLTALKLKREMMAEDKGTKPSSLKKMDQAITRGEIYKETELPYEMIDAYKSTGVEEWRKMGDPDSDEYDQAMYDQLWKLDEMMAGKKVSYKKGDPEEQKYSAKKSGSGKGGRGGGRGGSGGSAGGSTNFGTIGDMGPKVKEYSAAAMSGSNMPVIGVKRPNIVHKISSSR